jgi:parallel beta-helix repeat protein
MLTLLLIGMLTLVSNIQPAKTSSTTIIVPDDYPTIQEAIGAASWGDTIYVKAGTYYENVVVDRPVSLVGENKYTTIIDGMTHSNCLWIGENNVSVSGFTIQNSANTTFGIETEGNNSSIENNIFRNDSACIGLFHSSYNTISGNMMVNSSVGCAVNSGGTFSQAYFNNFSCNIIEVENLGIWFYGHCNYSVVSGNSIINCSTGVEIRGHDGNIKLYHNTFINNTAQVTVYTDGCTNLWDDGYPSGGNYWSDYVGLDSYSGPNQDLTGSDGIGDTPYVIDSWNQDNYPFISPATQPNIAIKVVATSKAGCLPMPTVGQGYNVNVTATLANWDYYPQTFNVTLYSNATLIEKKEVTIGGYTALTVPFTWNTTGFAKGNYTISVNATLVPDETDIADNTLADGEILITIPGDINGDQYVNAKDAVLLGAAFNSNQGQSSFNPNADINDDSWCNAKDAVILGMHFNEHW